MKFYDRITCEPPGYLKKLWMIMKLVTFLLIISLSQVSAAVYSQQINLNEKNSTLKDVLKKIAQQSGYRFLYGDELMTNTQAITVKLSNADLETALKACFADQAITYTIKEKTIILQQKSPTLLDQLKSALNLDKIEVHGKVTDTTGAPIAGANVIIKGSSESTTTDAAGLFTLKNVDPNATVVISYIGFTSRELPTKDNLGRIELRQSTNALDAVEVIAYGETTERLSTGDITTVSAKTIEEQPVTNPLLALEGRVPGLFITQSTGFANSGVTVRIQGQNSMQNGNDPLYVIDGVPYSSQLLPTINGILGSSNNDFNGGNPLSFINPNDIESISVLKDADATSIYGSRAANGAILITTKKGKSGATQVNVDLQNGWGSVPHFLDLMNTPQYLQMRHEAFTNSGTTPGPTDYDLNGLWNQNSNTNWQKVLIGGTAQYLDYNASVSGGNENTQFLIGSTYHRETTVFPGDMSDAKGSVHFSLSNTSANKKFKIQLTGSYLFDNEGLINTDLTDVAATLAPDAPSIYNKDGSLNWAPDANGNSSWKNPLSFLYNTYSVKTNNLVSNAILSYEILPGLSLRSSFGYTNLQSNEVQLLPLIANAPEQRAYLQSTSFFENSNINSWSIEPQLEYQRAIGKGTLDALIGCTANQLNSSQQGVYGYGYTSDLLLNDLNAAATVGARGSNASIYKYNAGFSRLNYNWDNTYILDLSARRDGSSRFGADNEFHDFWSAAGAWIFSKENLFAENAPWLGFGKFRASYGTTGNDQIGDYQFLNQYSPIGVPVPYQGVAALQPNGISNPFLQWEETRKLSLGLELGFLKNRILLNTNYSLNRSSNELLSYALPEITGVTGITENFPATVENTSWEFTLNTVNVKNKDFNWTTSINLTLPQNKLIAFPGLAESSYASSYIIGQSITIYKAYHYLGVNPTTGLYQFEAANGKTTSSPNSATDMTVLENTLPKFYGGFQNSFSYKGFRLDVLFQFVKQIGRYTERFGNHPGEFSSNSSGSIGNQPASLLAGAWTGPGDNNATIQELTTTYSGAANTSYRDTGSSDAEFVDASYIRLKNLSLSWQLPMAWQKAAHLQNSNLFVQGQNLMTITKYPGEDPEVQGYGTLPPLRVLTMGVKASL